MNRITHTQSRRTDWALLAERIFFAGLLLVVGGAFYSAFSLTTTSAPIRTEGMIRQAAPISAPSRERPTVATVLGVDVARESACVCSKPQRSR